MRHLALLVLSLLACGSRSAFAQGVLHALSGGAPGDVFAWSLEIVGDVDLDGAADFVVGAPQEDGPAGTDSGVVRLYSGRTEQVLLALSGSAPGDEFGFAVAAAGDVDQDGVPDLLVGARTADVIGVDSGRAAIVSLRTGAVLLQWSGDSAGDVFGYSVDSAGDVDADGFLDAIVGAEHDSNTGINAGSARVFSGKTGAQLHVTNGAQAFDCAGIAVAGLSDVDGDGRSDFAVGSYRYDAGSLTDAGAVRAYSGATAAQLFQFAGTGAGDNFGIGVDGCGDVDQDGVPDLIAGARNADLAGQDSGLARVFSLSTGALLYEWKGNSAGDLYGFRVHGAGDCDGDGVPDLLVGARFDDWNGTAAGSVELRSGATGQALFFAAGDVPGATFGRALGAGGDVNGDGFADFMVGAQGSAVTSAGEARVYSGKCGTGSVLGTGCAGGSSAIPSLALEGCATPGGTIALKVAAAAPGSPALLLVGAGTATLSLPGGCQVVVAPLLPVTIPLMTSASGALAIGAKLPAPLVVPVTAAAQILIADPGAAGGVAATPGIAFGIR